MKYRKGSIPKILLTTVYRRFERDYYDYFRSNTNSPFRFSLPRKTSYGLRFLRQNIPEIEILEYPTWQEYIRKLKQGWDVVGFSFYLNETGEIIRMAEEARRQGVKELWAGNYGALTEGVENYFDKIFIGYGEEKIAGLLGKRIERLSHPPLFYLFSLGPFWLRYKIFGVLFTQRGCPMRCTFCQTPAFCPKPYTIPLEAIAEVLQYYRKVGVREVVILDENFATFKSHTERVVELMNRYGFYFTAMLRADWTLKYIDDWVREGFMAALIGVESLSPKILKEINKREEVEAVIEFTERMHRYHRWVLGYYMIGFEDDTEESIKEDLNRLYKIGIDFHQLCILTPLPRTPLWYEIDRKYGIFEKDWRKYDAKHLVWHHPNISPEKMERLLAWGFKRLNTPQRYLQSLRNLIVSYLQSRTSGEGVSHLLSAPRYALFFNERAQGYLF